MGKNKGGRPKKAVDFEKIDSLCAYHCTAEEIVEHLNLFDHDVSYDTVERRIKEKFKVTFAEYIQQKHLAHAKPKLRRIQWEMAEKNASMAIWLGKQYLGQKETIVNENKDISGIKINVLRDE